MFNHKKFQLMILNYSSSTPNYALFLVDTHKLQKRRMENTLLQKTIDWLLWSGASLLIIKSLCWFLVKKIRESWWTCPGGTFEDWFFDLYEVELRWKRMCATCEDSSWTWICYLFVWLMATDLWIFARSLILWGDNM